MQYHCDYHSSYDNYDRTVFTSMQGKCKHNYAIIPPKQSANFTVKVVSLSCSSLYPAVLALLQCRENMRVCTLLIVIISFANKIIFAMMAALERHKKTIYQKIVC